MVVVESHGVWSECERQLRERYRLTCQAVFGRAVAAAELCDAAVDDAHGAALALADAAAAWERHARGMCGIEQRSQFGRPDKALVAAGNVDRLRLQRGRDVGRRRKCLRED